MVLYGLYWAAITTHPNPGLAQQIFTLPQFWRMEVQELVSGEDPLLGLQSCRQRAFHCLWDDPMPRLSQTNLLKTALSISVDPGNKHPQEVSLLGQRVDLLVIRRIQSVPSIGASSKRAMCASGPSAQQPIKS